MENIVISNNGLYILTSENLYSVVEDKTYSIDEIELPKWLDILSENTKYSIKNNLVEIKTLASYHRRVTYQLMENLSDAKKFNLMLEYEGKFGNLLLTENVILIEGWFDSAWNWTKDKVGGALNWVSDKVKSFGSFAVKSGKDLVTCITGGGCSPLFEDFREMLYSPVGIGIEVFLSATGIGGIGPIVAWGMMGLWDVGLLLRGDPSFSWLNLILDILGVGLGAIAKGFRSIFGGAAGVSRTAGKGIGEVVADGMKNPATKGIFTRLGETLSTKLEPMMSPLQKASEFLTQKLKLSWAGKAYSGFKTQVAKIMDAMGVKASEKSLGKELTNPLTGRKFKSTSKVSAANQTLLRKGVGQGVKHGTIAGSVMAGAETETGQNIMKKAAGLFGGNSEGKLKQTIDKLKNIEPVPGIEF